MAILRLHIGKIKVATCTGTDTIDFDSEYLVSLQDLKLKKKMYQPTEVIATLQIYLPVGTKWEPVGKKDIMNAFFHKIVVVDVLDDASIAKWTEAEAIDMIGNDYYVHEVIPTYKSDSLFVELRIYSLDKLLTLNNCCSSWTAKKLSENILASQLPKYGFPGAYKHLECDTSKMKHILKDGKEHIFPYLVQYNESFYDMLARTCNRWGEFLYWEDGKLRIGYDANNYGDVGSYYSMTFHDNTSTQRISAGNTYSPEATYDNNVLNSKVMKDGAAKVFGTIKNMADMKTGADYYWLRKVGQVLTNNKSVMNFLFDTAVNDLLAFAQQEAIVSQYNDKHNNDYFNKKKEYISTLDDQYGKDDNDVETLNQFSEYTPILNAGVYAEILAGEMLAEQNTVDINYDTTWPKLKLGNIINAGGEKYIVVEISSSLDKKNNLVFKVVGIAENEGKFYPMMIPSGHVRQSGPQVAVVADVEDPNKKNRVRLLYPWQLTLAEKSYDTITAADLKSLDLTDATPWLIYAASSGPKEAGVHGRHYLAEKVLVNYANNNVERPFVVGAVSTDTPRPLKTSSAVIQAPNGEFVKVHEGSGKGATAFMANFTPGLSLVNGFLDIPDLFGADNEMSKAFEGGVELGDKYGIWKISGSTDRRAIDISSPWGNVSINAFTGITVNAPNGNINIRGKNVSIEAGNNLTLKSGTNIRNKFASSYGGDARFNITSFMYDATAMAAKKLATMVESIVDLSLIRSLIEVYWKPQEGALTIQSNRYLMLGAGGALPGYPNQAYLKPKVFEEREKKLTDAVLPKPIKGMMEVLNLVPKIVDIIGRNYKERYERCVDMVFEFEQAIGNLHEFSDTYNPNDVCHNYWDLKDIFWDPNKIKIEASDIGFNNNVCNDEEISKVGEKSFNSYVYRSNLTSEALTDKDYIDTLKNEILDKRKQLKSKVVEKANALLYSIYNLIEEPHRIATNLTEYIGPMENYASAEYFKALQPALSAEKNRDTPFFKYAYDKDKKITDERTELMSFYISPDKLHCKALIRHIALQLVDSWGMKSKPIKFKIEDNKIVESDIPVKPQKPVTDEELANDALWQLYVESLQFIDSPANVGTLLDELADVFDPSKFNLATPFKEYYSWGNSKAGRILFGTGSTYCMNEDGTISELKARYNLGKLSKALYSEKQQNAYDRLNESIRGKLLNINLSKAAVDGDGAQIANNTGVEGQGSDDNDENLNFPIENNKYNNISNNNSNNDISNNSL